MTAKQLSALWRDSYVSICSSKSPLHLALPKAFFSLQHEYTLHCMRPRKKKTPPCLALRSPVSPSPLQPAPVSIKQQCFNINVPSLFAVTRCDYGDFSYRN